MQADICSIMYNEEVLLPLWIESWLKIPFVNKIYLVDGKSTDRSIEIAKSYDRVSVTTVPWKNDFARQRNIALRLSKNNIKWILQPDIDELPCGNFEKSHIKLDLSYNQIVIPYVKFYDWDTLWFFKQGMPSYKNGMVILANNKSTTTIFQKNHLKGYSKSLHEMPMYSGPIKKKDSCNHIIELKDLKNNFFMGHFDQTKHFEQSRINNTSVEFEMGRKRLRYRLISPATYSGKVYDKKWAEQALSQLKNGKIKMIEELGVEQLKSFMDEHTIVPPDDFNASTLFSRS